MAATWRDVALAIRARFGQNPRPESVAPEYAEPDVCTCSNHRWWQEYESSSLRHDGNLIWTEFSCTQCLGLLRRVNHAPLG